ncbi:DUF3226 domain-containing protein [Succinimonas sp.]|uniref:DUF3226 domain-containing protein n=1 Tax=Succinimonas sp. TaxID=1936151 RepID=UPI00386421DD
MALKMKSIVKNYIILCEGVDTVNFLLYYLCSKELDYDPRFADNIQLFNFGGITDLSLFIRNLMSMENFDKVNTILIVRDAETDVDKAISSVKIALKKSQLPVPDNCNLWKRDEENNIKVAFTLMPMCSSNPTTGALEDLCWNILANDPRHEMRTDVTSFVSRMKEKYHRISALLLEDMWVGRSFNLHLRYGPD